MSRPKSAAPRTKTVAVLFSEDEYTLLEEASKREGTKISAKARVFLLGWFAEALKTRGGVRGGICGSTSGCKNNDAVYYNRLGRFFLCESCALKHNQYQPGMCVIGEGPDRMPEDIVKDLRARVEEAPIAQELCAAKRVTNSSIK